MDRTAWAGHLLSTAIRWQWNLSAWFSGGRLPDICLSWHFGPSGPSPSWWALRTLRLKRRGTRFNVSEFWCTEAELILIAARSVASRALICEPAPVAPNHAAPSAGQPRNRWSRSRPCTSRALELEGGPSCPLQRSSDKLWPVCTVLGPWTPRWPCTHHALWHWIQLK